MSNPLKAEHTTIQAPCQLQLKVKELEQRWKVVSDRGSGTNERVKERQ